MSRARPAPIASDDARVKAFLPGVPTSETQAQIDAKRADLAERRKKRDEAARGGERRSGERRSGDFDRRGSDRRFAQMDDKLAAEAKAHEQPDSTRYTGSPSAFMESLK